VCKAVIINILHQAYAARSLMWRPLQTYILHSRYRRWESIIRTVRLQQIL